MLGRDIIAVETLCECRENLTREVIPLPDEQAVNNLALLQTQSQVRWLFKILDAIYDGVMVVDKNGSIVYANPAYTRTFGVPVQKVLNRKLSDIEPGARMMDVLQTGEPVVDDPSFVVSAGTSIVSNITPIFEENELVGAVAVFRDRTEILSMQEKMRLTMEEAEKNRQLTDRYYSELQELRARFLDIGDVVFESRAMQKIMALILRLVNVDSTVLITGESGVGKEIVARLIHRTSRRSGEAFVTINCGAIPESLLESELFGYEKGSFTGASPEGKLGLLEIANHGTILLDEIGELPLFLQVKLLRAIQEQEIMRIGGLKPISLDVRILAASNRDLKAMAENGNFRKDLFYRLNVVPIHVPPLRERPRDIIQLTRLFLAKYNRRYQLEKKLAPEVLRCLEQYDWPGNVRELENLIERLVVCADRDVIDLQDEIMAGYFKTACAGPLLGITEVMPWKEARAQLEKNLLTRALALAGTSRAAARLLSIDHSTVLRKARKYRLTPVK
ncbi:MAG TPA: sigma 54-interacting transcriptional regulator [Spirochaetia bacterium]|nr:sigma 54-interacting transcriptional regulator [Spirochaetia bacterium]